MTNGGEVLRSLLPPDGAASLRLRFMCLGTLLQSDRRYARAAEMRWTSSAVRYGEELSYGGGHMERLSAPGCSPQLDFR